MRLPEHPPNPFEAIRDQNEAFVKALGESAFRDFTRKCEAKYWPWDLLRFASRPAKVDPKMAWAFVKLGRMQHYSFSPLQGEGGQHIRYTLPSVAQQELMLIDQELAGRVGFDDELPLSKPMRERFVLSALQEEAIASIMLEGAATTRQDARQMLRSGRQPRTIGEQMVVNNYRTIQFIRSSRSDLSPEYLLEIQELLTAKTLENPGHIGRFRTSDDNVTVVDRRDGTVMHVPPPATELTDRLKMLCDYANQTAKADTFIHPVIKAILLHFQIGYDHPFCDGNGRTARAIFYWHLLRTGYSFFEFLPISPMFLRSPGRYARAYLYTETDDFDATYFIMYNLRVVRRGRERLRQYIERKQSQLAQAHRIFHSDPHLNHRQKELLLKAARNPDTLLTINVHQRSSGIAYATARADLLQLADWNYLKMEKVRNRFVFVQGPKLQHLDLDQVDAPGRQFEIGFTT